VTRYLLDTNISSNVTKPAPSEHLLAWMADQADANLFVASLTIAEMEPDKAGPAARSTPSSRPSP
jgi:predicted nucleic acid-binding protein